MRIALSKFGDMLLSRPSGREAFLILLANQLRNIPTDELIEIDFSGVQVMGPSWADEVITKIAAKYQNIKLLHTENSSVQATLKTLRDYSGFKH